MSGISSARSRLSACLFLLFILAQAVPVHAAEPDLTIFFSSDTRGMLRRCGCSEGQLGGLSARASFIRQNRVPGRTLVVDAGDTILEGPDCEPERKEFYAIRARALFAAMKVAGYDAAAVGEYDLSCGWEMLADAAKENGIPLVASNVLVREDGKTIRPFTGIVTKPFPGFKVAVVGALDSEFPCGSFRCYTGLALGDTKKYAEEAVQEASKRADLVIVLAHLSLTDPVTFVKGLPGANIVIQGHSQEELEKPIQVGDTLLVKGFYRGKHIGRLDLWLTPGKPVKIKDYKYSMITLDETVPPDKTVEWIIAGYRKKLKEKAFSFAKPDPAGSGRFVGYRACRGCHVSQFENWSGTKHARSLAALVKTGDQYDPECLACHTTGYGFVSGYGPGKAGTGLGEVGCECCHGRGVKHVESGVAMRRQVPEKVCQGCHDEYNSPNFEYKRYLELGGAHRGK